MVDKDTNVLLLDGDCGLCHRLAMFMDKNLDSVKKIKFQPIESSSSQELIQSFPKKQQNMDTVYLYMNGKSYTRSSAAIRCLLFLKWYWPLIYKKKQNPQTQTICFEGRGHDREANLDVLEASWTHL